MEKKYRRPTWSEMPVNVFWNNKDKLIDLSKKDAARFYTITRHQNATV